MFGRLAALACLLVGAAATLPACSGTDPDSPDEFAVAPDANEPEVIRVDPSSAVRLRRMADASVAQAVRAFGPADGLPLDELGARLYRSRGCVECHGPAANPIGPSLTAAFGTLRAVEGRDPLLMDLDYINVALMRPDALIAKGYPAGKMPSYEGTLYPREVLALAVYLQGASTPPRLPDEGESVIELPRSDSVNRVDAPLIPPVSANDDGGEADEADTADPARSDGRPEWWFDGVRREDGRVSLCVEALGPTFSEARGAAIERGRGQLADRMGLAPSAALNDLRVRYIFVTPLPNRGTGTRYAAYAMVSVLPGE